MHPEFDESIAQRELQGAGGVVVVVELGAPKPFEAQDPTQGWYCPFRVEGAGDEPWLSFAGGIDGVQAIILAFARVGDFLASRDDLGLTFEGRSGDLGFLSALRPPVSDWARLA